MTRHDLTHPVTDGMTVYPGDPPVSVGDAATMTDDGYRVSRLELGSHAGTHVDAPAHTEPDGRTLDSYDVDEFALDARLVAVDADAREPIEPDAFPERVDADLLVIHTGWDAHWGTEQYENHPYLTAAAAERVVALDCHLAVDCFSPDPTGRKDEREPEGVPAHHALLGSEKLVFENLTGLGALPESFRFRAYPLRVDGDGAPVRAVAEV
ncbi:cyclase family protein [Halocalculus aciditolerans]|uniref:Cyclase n=1 Tax=Halocalculus aciditolerans TaxID=1383812 RepID=A0A830F729_9EURY|nr:cyclase family protein [Halocalculus aciditolerans]GGL60966.1 cyclase [Halocalculus aciditolerans]